MTSNVVPFQNPDSDSGSPFDSIRRFDEHGNECWYGRELMSMLGYSKWERFGDAIDRAKVSCKNAGNVTAEHFFPGSGSYKGRPREDYKLTRYACYLVAMNGDPRKPEIGAAQSYFAVKTREAEVVIPAQSARLQELQAENQNMELRLKVYEAQQKTLAAAGMLALSAPALVEAILTPGVTVIEKVEHIDRTVIVDGKGNVVSQFDGIGITAIQKQFGFKSTKAAWTWLESIGYGKDSEHWKVEPTKVDALKLDRSVMSDLKAIFSQRKGNRQKLLGE